MQTGGRDGNDAMALTWTGRAHRTGGINRDKDQRKEESRHPKWDDNEIRLVIGLRAQQLSWPTIKARHFPAWSSSGLSKRFHQLQNRLLWKAEYEAVLRLEEPEQIAYIDRAESAVSRRHSQQFQEGQEHGADEKFDRDENIEDEAVADEAVTSGPNDEDRIDEDVHEMSSLPTMKKGRVDRRRGKRTRHAWDDYETELLVALRARGVAFKKLLEHGFPDWSIMGIWHKFEKAKETERWETRFQAIRCMDEFQQLATIASAQEAVARSRRQRAQSEQTAEAEDENDDHIANNGAVDEAITDEHDETASREVIDEPPMEEPLGPRPTEVDEHEVPEPPDPEMARTAPAKMKATVDLDDGESESEV